MTVRVCAALALLAGACSMHVERPVFHPRSADWQNVAADGITIRVALAAYNPNTFDLPLSDLTATLTLTGSSVPARVTHLDAVLPPMREVMVSADIVVPWHAWPEAAWIAATHPVLHYRVEGDITAQHYLSVRSHFTLEGDVSRDRVLMDAARQLGLPRS